MKQSKTNPFKETKTNEIIEEYEVDKYLGSVEQELKKCELKLNDSKQLPQISTLLDQLSSPSSFNKTLLNHIIDFSNFDITKPIKLQDFFRAYFSVYENMLKTREIMSNENISLATKLKDYQSKFLKIKSSEKKLSSGLTSSSCFQILLKNIQKESLLKDYSKILVKFSQAKLQYEFNIINNNDRENKKKIPIKDLSFLSNNTIRIYCYNRSNEEKLLDTIDILDLNREEPLQKDYPLFSLSFLLMVSKANCLNREIAIIENRINTNNESISVINESVNQIQSKSFINLMQ